MRVLFCSNTSNYIGRITLAGMPYRCLALNEAVQQLSETDDADGRRVEVRSLLRDVGVADTSWSGWPFSGYLVHADFGPPVFENFTRALSGWRPDVIIVSNPYEVLRYGYALAKHLGARLIYEIHDDDFQLLTSLGSSLTAANGAQSTQKAAALISDGVVVLTEYQEKLVRQWGVDRDRVCTIPMATNVGENWGLLDISAPPSFVFLGNMYHPPNNLALTVLLDHVLPDLRASGVDVEVEVVGRMPADLAAQTSDYGVSFHGPAEDLNLTLRSFSVGLCPVWTGSGMKSKIADYLGSGLAVVASDQSLEGYRREVKEAVVEARNAAEFADGILRLCQDPQFLIEVRQASFDVASRFLSWSWMAVNALNFYTLVRSSALRSCEPLETVDRTVIGETLWERALNADNAWAYPRMVVAPSQVITLRQ